MKRSIVPLEQQQRGINMVDLMMWLVIAALLLAAAIQGIGYYQKASLIHTLKSDLAGASQNVMAATSLNKGVVTRDVLNEALAETKSSTEVVLTAENATNGGLPFLRASHPAISDVDGVYLFEACGTYPIGTVMVPKAGDPLLEACGVGAATEPAPTTTESTTEPAPTTTTEPAPEPTTEPSPEPTIEPVVKTVKAIEAANTMFSYEAPGNTTLGTRTALAGSWTNIAQVIDADWNSDGRKDLIVRYTTGKLEVHIATSNTAYDAPLTIGESDWQYYDLAIVKLRNTDAYPGIIARNVNEGNLYYYPNNAGTLLGLNGEFRKTIGSGGWGPMTNISPIDWDKNGTMDFITRNGSGELIHYFTDGNGTIIGGAKVDFGWGVMDNIAIHADFAGPGTTGIIARVASSGDMLYYPIVNSAIQPSTKVATDWRGFHVVDGSIH